MKLLLLLTSILILSGCQPMPPPPVPPDSVVDADVPALPDVAVVVDAAPAPEPPEASVVIVVDAGDIFDQACANLRRLKCDEGFDKAGQQSCATVMRHAETAHLTKTYPDCVAGANAVSAAKQCGRYCKVIRK
jgi:hypothetical protein